VLPRLTPSARTPHCIQSSLLTGWYDHLWAAGELDPSELKHQFDKLKRAVRAKPEHRSSEHKRGAIGGGGNGTPRKGGGGTPRASGEGTSTPRNGTPRGTPRRGDGTPRKDGGGTPRMTPRAMPRGATAEAEEAEGGAVEDAETHEEDGSRDGSRPTSQIDEAIRHVPLRSRAGGGRVSQEEEERRRRERDSRERQAIKDEEEKLMLEEDMQTEMAEEMDAAAEKLKEALARLSESSEPLEEMCVCTAHTVQDPHGGPCAVLTDGVALYVLQVCEFA
jgi:hypothetical protein